MLKAAVYLSWIPACSEFFANPDQRHDCFSQEVRVEAFSRPENKVPLPRFPGTRQQIQAEAGGLINLFRRPPSAACPCLQAMHM